MFDSKTKGKFLATLKMHSIFCHVPYWCKKHGCSLGKFSEQQHENLHPQLTAHEKRYRISKDSPDYKEKKTRQLESFNSLHLGYFKDPAELGNNED